MDKEQGKRGLEEAVDKAYEAGLSGDEIETTVQIHLDLLSGEEDADSFNGMPK